MHFAMEQVLTKQFRELMHQFNCSRLSIITATRFVMVTCRWHEETSERFEGFSNDIQGFCTMAPTVQIKMSLATTEIHRTISSPLSGAMGRLFHSRSPAAISKKGIYIAPKTQKRIRAYYGARWAE